VRIDLMRPRTIFMFSLSTVLASAAIGGGAPKGLAQGKARRSPCPEIVEVIGEVRARIPGKSTSWQISQGSRLCRGEIL